MPTLLCTYTYFGGLASNCFVVHALGLQNLILCYQHDWSLDVIRSHKTGPWFCLTLLYYSNLGTISIEKCCLTSIGITMLKVRRSCDRLNFNMGIPYMGKTVFILRRGPGRLWVILAGNKPQQSINRNRYSSYKEYSMIIITPRP